MAEILRSVPAYRLIRSRRKTLALEIRDGELLVRAPLRMPKGLIEAFILEKRNWIDRARKKAETRKIRAYSEDLLSDAELHELRARAAEVLSGYVSEYAPLIGVNYGRITIRLQKSLWGSCSSKGNLNFNCLLMLAPESVQRYVVIHELCHRKAMNHSAAFWAEVAGIMPDYRKEIRWLKENGPVLMARAGIH